MGMTAGAGGHSLQSEINVTPMVAIMLVLLIIFMVVAPFLQPGITVPVPKDMNNPDIDSNIIRESSVVISIPQDVEYYLGKKRHKRSSSPKSQPYTRKLCTLKAVLVLATAR